MKTIERALLVAEKAHANQTYDIYPYMYHIERVVEIAKELRFRTTVIIACALHDALEDSDLSYNDIKKGFGEAVAETVYCVTDELGRNRGERKKKTFPKIRSNYNAISVKLCDRIANVEHSKEFNEGLFKMYRKEQPLFEEAIREDNEGGFPEEIEHAFEILNDLFR